VLFLCTISIYSYFINTKSSKNMASRETPPIDRLTALLERFRVSAQLFYSGALCGVTTFAAQPGRGFLHVLRRGEMTVTHRRGAGVPRRIELKVPTLIFYAQPIAHDFHNAPRDGSDLTCASVNFEGGASHPIVRALPPLVILPLHRIEGLDAALNLLFAEADQVRCGRRLVADRLFEVVLLQLVRWLLDHPEESGLSSGLVTGLSDAALSRALTALHEQPGVAWSLEAMAGCAGMSRSAFAAKFKAVLGTTPADYLADWRITIAKSHLRTGRSVKFIADVLGYANASALSRVFAQRTGASPRAWLESRVAD
jgi:AraC-like DNA-binding protein